VEGNPGGPGRPRGSKNSFPRGTKQIMKGVLSGEFRDSDSGETAGLKVAKLIMDGLDGKAYQERIGPDGSITKISVSQAVFAKLLFDRMEHEDALEAAQAKEKGTGGGGIRIVLPSVPADPLLKPGQTPRPLRILGQDPSKPLPGSPSGDSALQPGPNQGPSTASRQLRPAPPSPPAEEAFDPSELIEDFEHPICECCMGIGCVRDENGIKMVKCEACEGAGRAPWQESW
jgi:hypothetical protein